MADTKATPVFAKGDQVAWGDYAAQFAAGSILTVDAAEANGLTVGTVKKVANAEGTWFDVDFDGDVRTLTQDELVKVAAQ